MSIRSIGVLLLILVLPPSFRLVAQTDSCSIAWEPIQQISHDSVYSYVPQVLAVGDTVHMIWWGTYTTGVVGDSGKGIQYSRSTDGGQTFLPERQLVTLDSSRGTTGCLAASGSYLYMMYLALVDSPAYSNTGLLRSTDAGLTWEPRRLLGDISPRAITTKDSNVYIYFFYVENNFARSGFYMSHDYGVTWDSIHVPAIRASDLVQLVSTPMALHMTRRRAVGSGLEVFYNRSFDFGYTWTHDDTLSSVDGFNSQAARFAGEKNGNLYLVWNDQKYGGGFSGTIVMRRSTDEGLTWLPEQIVSQLATAVFCDVAVEGSTVAVTWDNDLGTFDAIRIKLSQNYGESWCQMVDASVDTSHAGDPSVSVDNGRINLTWSQSGEVFYRRGLFQPTSVKEQHSLPSVMTLEPNYPNPFNPVTVIRYTLPAASYVTMKVYSLLGEEVATLLSENKAPGKYQIEWDAGNYPSGVYFYRLQSEKQTLTKKMLLLR